MGNLPLYQSFVFLVEELEADIKGKKIDVGEIARRGQSFIDALQAEGFHVLTDMRNGVGGIPFTLIVGGPTPAVKSRVYDLANEKGLGDYLTSEQGYFSREIMQTG